jgi:hypothetical protein
MKKTNLKRLSCLAAALAVFALLFFFTACPAEDNDPDEKKEEEQQQPPSIVKVIIQGNATTVKQGEMLKFTVEMSDGFPQPVRWGIFETDLAKGTYISAEGVLFVDAKEEVSKTITVAAILVNYPKVNATADEVTVEEHPVFASILSPSKNPWILRVNGFYDFDDQLVPGSVGFLKLNEGDEYIFSANVFDLEDPEQNDPDNPIDAVLRFRVYNRVGNNIYWENGIFIKDKKDWMEIDQVFSRPGFEECSANEITPLTGEWEGWYNVKMKYKVPTVGSWVSEWKDFGYEIQSDYTLVGESGAPAKTTSPDTVKTWLKDFTIALQVQRFGKSYLVDNVLFYLASEGESGNLNPGFDKWSEAWNFSQYNPVDGFTGKAWMLLPTANAD